MGRLAGKVALISGSARGSGAAAARAFVGEEANVAIGDILDAEGKALADELGEAALFVHLDVTKEDDWLEAVRQTEERFGRLDVVVNNAGILVFGTVEATTVEQFMKLVSVNQLGVFLGMKASVPALRRAGGGSIVNVASVEGLRGAPALLAYSSTKFAVRGMTKAAAVELGGDNIRVNAVCPGVIDTPMLRSQGLEGFDLDKIFRGIPMGRIGKPEDIADAMLFLASDDSAYINGTEIVCDGGATQFIGWFHRHRSND